VAYWADNMAQDKFTQAADWKKQQLIEQLEELDERLDSLGLEPCKNKEMLWNKCHAN